MIGSRDRKTLVWLEYPSDGDERRMEIDGVNADYFELDILTPRMF